MYTVPPAPPTAVKVEPESLMSQPSVTSAFSITLILFPPVLMVEDAQSSAQIPTAEGAVLPALCEISLLVMFTTWLAVIWSTRIPPSASIRVFPSMIP